MTTPTLLPWTIFVLELRRLVRNRRTVVLNLVLPSLLFVAFSSGVDPTQSVGHGNVTASVMVGLAVYAAMAAATSTGAGVGLDRAAGWSRQLRLSPLRPVSYVVLRAAVALVAGAAASGLVLVVGAVRGAHTSPGRWLACGLLAWACSSVFAALGLAVGYLLPGETATSVLGPLLGLSSFAGGLFVPVDTFGPTIAGLARWSPTWGAGELARWPLVGSAHLWTAILNVVVWTCVFLGLAAWRMRRDTRRV